jgi:general secretion pathway protein A
MYKAFFHLTKNPFDLTPDPSCFVPTAHHNEALASLYYGVRRHKGFVVVTGEVGTGKTLLLRCLLRLLEESKDIAYAYLFNSRLTPNEFLQYMLQDFGIEASGRNKAEMLFDLSRFLVSRGTSGLTTVLVIDEAHLLSPDLLEEIRLLSNLETFNDKLLQIVLVGQPELDLKLDSVNLRQLKQRIALRTHLTALNEEETTRYVEQRMQIAAAANTALKSPFTADAVKAIFHYSRGLPRWINTICENCLITAYARQSQTVSQEIVSTVAKELRIETSRFSESESIDSGHLESRQTDSVLDFSDSTVERTVAGSRAQRHR